MMRLSLSLGSRKAVPYVPPVVQVEIAPNDTLSRFEITNTASFPGATWAWYDDDGTAISGQTSASLLYSAVPAGELIKARANGDAGTDSLFWGVPQNNVVLDINFADEPNGALNGQFGLTADAGYNIIGGELTATVGDKPFSGSVGSVNQRISITLIVLPGSNNANGKRKLRLLSSTGDNYLELDIRPTLMQLNKRVSGTWYEPIPGVSSLSGTNGTGTVITGEVIWSSSTLGHLRVYRDGVRIDSGGSGPGVAFNADGNNVPQGVNFQFTGPESLSGQSSPISVLSALKVEAIPASGITISEVAFTDVGGVPAVNFTGSTAYTGMEAVFLSADGLQLGPIVPFTGLTPGAYDLEFDQPAETQGQSGAFLRVRDTSNPTNYTDHQLPLIPFFPPKFRKGINNSGGISYRNLFSSFEVRFPDNAYRYLRQAGKTVLDAGQEVAATAVGMDYDGVIQSYVSGWTQSICYLIDSTYIEQGVYEIYYDPALTCTLTNHLGGSLADATILTAFSGGYGKIDITSDTPSLRFTFTGGTSGSLNLKPTGYKEDDTNRTRLYAESATLIFADLPAGVERHLDTLDGNGDGVIRLTADQIWEGGAGVGGPLSPEMIAQKANAQGTDVWIPFSCLWLGEAYLIAFLTRLIAALEPARKLWAEPPNETWNRAFRTVTQWALERGVNAGFWNTDGDATPITSNYARAFEQYNPESAVKTMLQTYSTNDYVLFENIYGAGHALLRAKKDIVTGTADYPVISGSSVVESAAWLPIAQSGDCERAKMRYYAEWADTLWNIADQCCVDEGYDPREKIVRVIAWQQGSPPADIVDWNDIHQRVDVYAVAPYHNHELLDYGSTTLTSGEKALLGTDVPAFIDAFYAKAEAGMLAKVAEFPALKTSIDAVWVARGYAPNQKRTVTYEGNWHPITRNQYDGSGTLIASWHANMDTAFPQIRMDARFESLTTDYVSGWRDVFHDVFTFFNSVQGLPTSYDGRFGYWGLVRNNTDLTNPGYLGFKAVADEV